MYLYMSICLYVYVGVYVLSYHMQTGGVFIIIFIQLLDLGTADANMREAQLLKIRVLAAAPERAGDQSGVRVPRGCFFFFGLGLIVGEGD